MCESLVEVENFQQFLPIDEVKITVGEGTDVGHGLAHVLVLPEAVAEDVALPWKKKREQKMRIIL